jgi:diguanylate cyclase (GGDEF)-like protein
MPDLTHSSPATEAQAVRKPMQNLMPVLHSSEPDMAIVSRLTMVERFFLSMVLGIAFVNAAGLLLACLDPTKFSGPQWAGITSIFLMAASALSLRFSAPSQANGTRKAGAALALVVAIVAAVPFILSLLAPSVTRLSGVDAWSGSARGLLLEFPERISPESALVYLLLGVGTLLLHWRGRWVTLAGDCVTLLVLLLALIDSSNHVMSYMLLFGPITEPRTSLAGIVCLLLLSATLLFRRADEGIFSVLLGRGIGSKIARVLMPILFVLPYLREIGRARMLVMMHMPAQFETAMLASTAVVLSLGLLLFLCWRIQSMEREVHSLSLRDALTGLYNLRGFRLLAEQALRMADRADMPFSVLFVDLDDLKRTNDSLGHEAGSAFLVETGHILRAAFRESDVLGRIGGDEFAVAGQFSQNAITHAAQRITELAAHNNAASGRPIDLSFSLGYVTSSSDIHESLDELLAKADQAMYEEKRRRKVLVIH